MTGVYLRILFPSLWIHFILALDERTKQALIDVKVTEYRKQREKYIDNDKRRGQMSWFYKNLGPLYNSTRERWSDNSRVDICDGYFQFRAFAECVGCFFGVRTSECSLIIKSPGVLPMVVIVYVEQRITPGLLVYGDERSHNSSAMYDYLLTNGIIPITDSVCG
ncbi:unnamed protein product [Fasciola hepatica]|uniref:Uncharacterized protein n=1 Tax=Fasciola hepatica TaxID=6192 RepID=A0ABC9HJG5_FASHE